MNRNLKMREEKRKLILDHAKGVFETKGYLQVTMKDIIEACDISRGGIYLYFKSVEEIFRELLIQRERKLHETIQDLIERQMAFQDLLHHYLMLQKERYQNIDASLLRAMYEFQFSHKNDDLRSHQLTNIQSTLYAIFDYGVQCKVMKADDVEDKVESTIIFLEGLSIYVLSGVFDETHVDRQLHFLETVIIYD